MIDAWTVCVVAAWIVVGGVTAYLAAWLDGDFCDEILVPIVAAGWPLTLAVVVWIALYRRGVRAHDATETP